jgi:histidinol-phosphatase
VTGHGPEGSAVAELVEVARELAIQAGDVTLCYFGEVMAADTKSDGSPVTRADRKAEELLRTEIRKRYPDHSLLGEELGEYQGTTPVRWILDPIDGTRAYMRGVPFYAVLIGIEVDDELVGGVAHFPALGETVVGCKGAGCTWWPSTGGGPVPARVSEVQHLEEALILTTDPEGILTSEVADGWHTLSGEVDLVRGWGDAYGHVLVATGRAEVMVDPILSPWDAAPLLPIMAESGGRFTDLSGRSTIHGGSGVSSNTHLYGPVMEILRSG